MTRPLALTIPAVTVLFRPKGFPMAITQSPTRSRSESPSAATGSIPFGWIHTRAMSVFGSRPMIFAGNSSLVASVTMTSFAPSTTWLLVTIRPSWLMMKPLPAPCCLNSRGPGGISPKKC
ncbi:MAG: hypothetical protein EWM72_03124 [Nitrospira sp.]|nr:MAG: hypothetical protein EWM72_03124 [Nitrospira sp.]